LPAVGDSVTVNLGGQDFSYTVLTGDDEDAIAAGLKAAIDADANFTATVATDTVTNTTRT
jgi:phage tail sheath gpL-like